MRYYITDDGGNVVNKFDGIDVPLKDGHERHFVESADELSAVTIDKYDADYEQF